MMISVCCEALPEENTFDESASSGICSRCKEPSWFIIACEVCLVTGDEAEVRTFDTQDLCYACADTLGVTIEY